MTTRYKSLVQILIIVGFGGLLQFLINQGYLNAYIAHVMTNMCIFIIAAVSLNLINGICGQFSIGHAGFMAVGAYTAAIITKNPTLIVPALITGYPRFIIATVIAGLIAAFVGLLVGLPSLRLRGDYLAITTLGFGEIIRILLINWNFVGGASGYFGIQKFTSFGWAFAMAVITIIIVRNFIMSSHGRACVSIREDEIAAETMGIPTTRYKVIAFVIAAFFAGTAGSMMAHLNRMVSPASFTFMLSIEVLLMVVLGGLGSISGSIGAAVFLTFATEALRKFRALRMILYSLMMIIIMIFRPKGLLGTQEITLPLMQKTFSGIAARFRRRENKNTPTATSK
jgi:branched-chain amino acid transport system permease protein